MSALIAAVATLMSTSARASDSANPPVVLFMGTSLTAGYGLPSEEAFPALLREKIQRDGFHYRVVNAGVSGDTTAGGLRRIDWLLRAPIEILVLELGANDMLRGLDPAAMYANLVAIVDRSRVANPDMKLLIAGMRAAPNLGPDFGGKFEASFLKLAERYNASLIPFLLEDVAAKANLNQVDGIHPTREGHTLIAERVWKKLRPLLVKSVSD